MTAGRALPWALLVAASLCWAGNWVVSRGIRETMPPIALSFFRWLVVVVLLAPIALPALRGTWARLKPHWPILVLLSALGVPAFTMCVYVGLQSTEAVNAVLLNSSVPVITIICAWLIDRQGATWRQIVGMILSFAGILVIVSRGEPARLLDLEFHRGDAWIMLAMPCWGLYSVLLKRRPKGLDGFPLVWLLATLGTLMTLPLVIGETLLDRAPRLTWGSAGTVLYLGIFASIIGYWCWNRGVASVGASNAGFTVHLLPAFGTVLAIVFLDESVHAFHAVGLVAIMAGVVAATAPQLGSSGGRTARNIARSSKS